jgi:prefoldin subunit 5
MKDKIDLLKAAGESLRHARLAVENLNAQEAELKAALEKAKAELANLPVESVALPEKGDKPFDGSTVRLVSSRNHISTKLELLPGIRVRYQAQAEGLKQQIQVLAKGLTNHCLDLARARMESETAEIAALLLPYHGGRLDRAKVAAAKVMQGAEVWESPAGTLPGCDA